MKKSQQDKIVALLQLAGDAGVSSFDLTYKWGIKQAPTRIHELKAVGYPIVGYWDSNKKRRYRLLGTLQKHTSQVTTAPKKFWIPIPSNGQPILKQVTQAEYEAFHKPKQGELGI